MSTVKQLAEEIRQGLSQALPTVNKPVVRKLSLAIGAMIEGRTPNTVELSNLLPLELERQDQREQWLRRLLSSPALSCETVIAYMDSSRFASISPLLDCGTTAHVYPAFDLSSIALAIMGYSRVCS